MSYKIEDTKGEFLDQVMYSDASEIADFYGYISDMILGALKEEKIPVISKNDYMKSGGLFGSKAPMLILSHPDKSCKYYDIGICVNKSIVSFYYLGESEEDTKYSKKKFYQESKQMIKAAMIKVDELALQQEDFWLSKIKNCIKTVLELN